MYDENNISNYIFDKNEYKNLNILNFNKNYILNKLQNKSQGQLNNNRIKSIKEFYDNIIRISPADFYYNTNRFKNEYELNKERKNKFENEMNNQIENNISSNHLMTYNKDINYNTNFNNYDIKNMKYPIRKYNNDSSNYNFICNNNYFSNCCCNTPKYNEELYYRLTNYY